MKITPFCFAPFVLAALLGAGTALATDAPAAAVPEAKSSCQFPDNGIPSPSIATSLPPGLADPGGVRAALGQRGVQIGLNYIADAMADVKGGMRRGPAAIGRVEFTADACLDKLMGWQGANFHLNIFQIHGTGPSRYYVGNIMAVSYVEALASTRLYEAWIEQKLLDGKLSIRVGQLGGDSDFLVSNYANFLLNGTTGWPAIFGSNMPSGGPAFPLATPGVRVKYQATDAFAVLAGLYNGDPAGPGTNDPQVRNRHGLDFRVRDKPLAMGELQYQYKITSELPGTAKLGAWYHFGRFNDQRFGTDGLSLADPASNGTARRHKGNGGIYGMVDQLVWHVPGADAANGIAMFARIAGNPSDRNLVEFYADAGLNFKGVFAARPNDVFGASLAWARVSGRARGLDLDNAALNGPVPVRDYELGAEISYVAQIVDGWTVQPDVQLIRHPGLHVANPRDPAGRVIKDAVVVGVRTTVNY